MKEIAEPIFVELSIKMVVDCPTQSVSPIRYHQYSDLASNIYSHFLEGYLVSGGPNGHLEAAGECCMPLGL